MLLWGIRGMIIVADLWWRVVWKRQGPYKRPLPRWERLGGPFGRNFVVPR